MNNLVLRKIETWETLLATRKEVALLTSLKQAPSIEVAEFLNRRSPRTLIRLLSLFKGEKLSGIFTHLNAEKQKDIYQTIPIKAFVAIFLHMPSSERVDFYQKLHSSEQANLLPYLKKDIKEDVINLSFYPEETAGGIMSTDFLTVTHQVTVEQAIKKT